MGLAFTLLSAQVTQSRKYFSAQDYSDFMYYIQTANVNYDLVADMIADGINVNKADDNGDTPLLMAARYERPATTDLLISSGAQLNARDRNGRTALWIAARAGYIEVLDKLLLAGASVNVCDNNGVSAMLIAYVNNYEIYRKLLAKAGEPDFSDLTACAIMGDAEQLREFLAEGYSPDEAGPYGWSTLQICLREMYYRYDYTWRGQDRPTNLIMLIDHSKKLEVQTPQGDGLLHLTAMAGNRWTTRHLIKKGLNVNQKNKLGDTPLILCAKHDNLNLVPMLLASDADANAKGAGGWTALMYTCANAYEAWGWDYLQALVDAGADPYIQNRDGQTSIDIARQYNKTSFVSYLSNIRPPIRSQK